MPGILPMKVIRVGSTAQSRIAQACDRCRSKKIRCDGVRPCCTQCANVGFECKTSDKLSRRAFPRGYTESLEDRVRGLEAEVRELKQLLDEKDEKIDMLSRIHSFSSIPRKPSASASPGPTQDSKSEPSPVMEEALEIIPPSTDSSVAPTGLSSASSFIESFKCKVAASGKSSTTIKSSALRPIVRPSSSTPSPKTVSRAPPRLLSDEYVNIFLQEWAPLFPVINRASFLKIYQEFLADPESTKWKTRKHDIAQLYLVFDIAALSSKSSNKQTVPSYEQEWRRAMQGIPSTACLSTLQCHVLAQILYLLKEDQKHFLRHRACGITMCHQLGLHLSQERLSVSLLEKETRKRIFWAQYIVDRFGSSTCGIPMLLRDSDITAEYPSDVDDENITATEIHTVSSGVTKMSNALALIQITRILSNVVETLHRPAAHYTIPISKFNALTEELDQWVSDLPSHLRLKFTNDKPSTGIISDRSPLLSLAEFYVRLLINRPLMAFATGNAASAAVLASADAAKHIVQLFDLLDERSMNYVFPLSKGNMLLTAGFNLLWQLLDLPSGSKLVKDNQKSLALISGMLSRESEPAATEFMKIMSTVCGARPSMSPPLHTANPNLRALHPMPAPEDTRRQKSSTRDHLRAIASRLTSPSFGNGRTKSGESTPQASAAYTPRALTQFSHPQRNMSQASIASAHTESGFPSLSPVASHDSSTSRTGINVNLDFFSLASDRAVTTSNISNKDQSTTTWEQMLASIDSGASNIYNGIYGGDFAFAGAFPADGPLNMSDIDPSVLSAVCPTAFPNNNNTAGASPPQNSNFLYLDSSNVNLWSSHDSLPSATSSSNTLVNLQDIQKATGATVPPQSVLSFNSEEDTIPSCSGGGEEYGSSGLSNSIYSDRGSNISRKATSVSSTTSAGGHSFDVAGSTLDGTTNTGTSATDLTSESPYGGIVIPNEYGIGF